MTYFHYIKQPMQAIEWKLILIFAKNPHLINSLHRYVNHPLIRNYSDNPFNHWKMCVLNITDDYETITFTNRTNIKNEDNNIVFNYLLFSTPTSLLIFSLKS